MSRTDDLQAELDLAVLEDELVKAKSKKSTKPADLTKIKNKVREARRVYREARES